MVAFFILFISTFYFRLLSSLPNLDHISLIASRAPTLDSTRSRRTSTYLPSKQPHHRVTIEPTLNPTVMIPHTTLHDDPGILIYSVGISQALHYDIGEFQTNSLYRNDMHKVIARYCYDCEPSHQIIYYRRLSPMPAEFSIYSNILTTWTSTNNILNVDFVMYNSLGDLYQHKNNWKKCDYDNYGVGFPRDCGRDTLVKHQWNSLTNSKSRKNYYFKILFIPFDIQLPNIDILDLQASPNDQQSNQYESGTYITQQTYFYFGLALTISWCLICFMGCFAYMIYRRYNTVALQIQYGDELEGKPFMSEGDVELATINVSSNTMDNDDLVIATPVSDLQNDCNIIRNNNQYTSLSSDTPAEASDNNINDNIYNDNINHDIVISDHPNKSENNECNQTIVE
eukprot:gene12241-16406_t